MHDLKDIKPIHNALAINSGINGYTYHWVDESRDLYCSQVSLPRRSKRHYRILFGQMKTMKSLLITSEWYPILSKH
ncbi:MAG: tail fiber domain-containing protein [Saprospiraceae bacterium]|nr:tail fiber domain-containing protein [Saprospiraceae bacterium]